MSSSLIGKLKSLATNSEYSEIRRRTAKLGEYIQASLIIVKTYLLPSLREYQHAITVEQVSSKSFFINLL